MVSLLNDNWYIRRCEQADLPSVLELEQSAYERPWTREQFLQELNANYSHIELLLLCDKVAGYICYWLAAGEMHVLNIATSTSFRRQGVARQLMTHALSEALSQNVGNVLLEVRIGNAAAIALYRDLGFTEDGLRKNYYSDGEDALLMSRVLEKTSNTNGVFST